MDDKNWFDKLTGFFGNKGNHHMVADAAKTGLWVALLLHFQDVWKWAGKTAESGIKAVLVSETFQDLSDRAKKLRDTIVSRSKQAVGVIFVGWAVTAVILAVTFDKETPANVIAAGGPSNEQFWAVIATAVELVFSLVAGGLILSQQIKIQVLVQLALEAERRLGGALAFVKKTVPSFLAGEAAEKAAAVEQAVAQTAETAVGLDKGRRTLWAIIWWLKILEFVVIDVLCVGYRVFNTLLLVLLVVNIAIALVAYRNAYGPLDPKYRLWAFRYLWKTVIAGFIIVAIGVGTLGKLGRIIGLDESLDARIAEKADKDKAKADDAKRVKLALEHMKAVKVAQDEIEKTRAADAADDLKLVQKEIEELEKKSETAKLDGDDVKKLAMLQARLKWDVDGRGGLAPWLADVKAASCEDGIDNDGDGYADKDDFACYRLDPTCKAGVDGCRNQFGNFKGGEAQTESKNVKVRRTVKDAAGNVVMEKQKVKDKKGVEKEISVPKKEVVSEDRPMPIWYRYNPNADEKKKEAKVEEKKPEPAPAPAAASGDSSPGASGSSSGKKNGSKGAANNMQENFKKLLAWKCARRPEWCQGIKQE